jgi:hypothetical protein
MRAGEQTALELCSPEKLANEQLARPLFPGKFRYLSMSSY